MVDFVLQGKFITRALSWLLVLYVLTLMFLIRRTVYKESIFPNLSTFPVEPIAELNPTPEPSIQWGFEDSVLVPGATFRNITILMWTEYYHNKDLTDHIKNESPIPEWCNVTFEKSKLNQSDAIVFHIPGTDMNISDLPPRNPNQPWVFYIIEPPIHLFRDPKPLNGMFNRTMTYRLDSDYPCLYGYMRKYKVPLSENPYFSKDFPRHSKES